MILEEGRTRFCPVVGGPWPLYGIVWMAQHDLDR